MKPWLILTATLPTAPSGLRVRVWRALKATGAGVLREGVYMLPSSAPSASALRTLRLSIAEAGADAHLLEVTASDAAQQLAFEALFDRAEHYEELLLSVKDARKRMRSDSPQQLQKLVRGLEQSLHQVQASDFFPGKSGARCASAVAALRREIELKASPDEPSHAGATVPSLAIADFQGRTWATRKRPWVDRLATAWLVQRYIDKAPRFIWLADAKKCPKSALGYDFDGATFSHVGDLVSFEVVAKSFGLNSQPGIARLGQLVHCLDVGGMGFEEAAGVELILRGLQAQHKNDDRLLQAACAVFDALGLALGSEK